jgi:hypothetical protein
MVSLKKNLLSSFVRCKFLLSSCGKLKNRGRVGVVNGGSPSCGKLKNRRGERRKWWVPELLLLPLCRISAAALAHGLYSHNITLVLET